MNRLKDKTALITGGSTGIGKCIAEFFAREGAEVAICSRTKDEVEKTVSEIKNGNGKAIGTCCDITKSSQVKEMVDYIIDKFGRLNVLVNNAGKNQTKRQPVEELTEEDWDEFFNTNAKGSWLCSKYAIPEIRKVGGGSIIMISSAYAHIGQYLMGCYNSSKAAQEGLIRSMALDYAKDNIRVNAICPGWVATQRNELEKLKDKVFDKPIGPGISSYSDIISLHPIGRIGMPEDIAWAAVYLASDESGWVTGASFAIDGGYTCK